MSPHLDDSIFGDHDAPDAETAHDPAPAPQTRSEARQRQQARAPRPDSDGSRASKIAVPLVAVALLLAVGFGAYKIISPMVSDLLSSSVEDYPGPGSGKPR